jgi:hypothetical protein
VNETALLLAGSAAIALGGLLFARQATRRAGWAAAGPFLLIAATPLVPSHPIASGLSLDDILPLVGVALLIPLVPWRSLKEYHWGPAPGPAIAVAGITLMILAGAISAVLNASDLVEAFRIAVRGSGRMAFLLVIAASLALLGATPAARRFSAHAIALIGTFEAAFGLIAYFVGFPFKAGLEQVIRSSVLYGQVPGRISGTIGNSPNFTGAIFVITTLITAGLALQAQDRRTRIIWWVATIGQLAALTLTYSRVSLGLTVIGLVVLVLMRSRPILLLPVGAVLVAVAMFTPLATRFFTDAQNRVALWTSAFLLMIDHPIGGVGAGETLRVIAANPERYRFTPLGSAWSTAHNTVLFAGAEMGVLGAVGAIALNLGLLLIAVRSFLSAPGGTAGSVQVAAALALAAFLVQGMVNNLFTVGVTGVFAAFLIGTQLLRARPAASPEASGAASRPSVEDAAVAFDQRAS